MATVREDENHLLFKFRNKKQQVHPAAKKDQMGGEKEGEPNNFLVKEEIKGPEQTE